MRATCGLVVVLASVMLVGACAGDGAGEGGEDTEIDDPAVTFTATTCTPPVDIVVFVNPAVDADAVAVIDQALRALPGVLEVRYVDQQTAFEEFARLFADSPELLATVEPQSLPSSFRLRLDDPDRARDVQVAAESLSGVGQVSVAPPELNSC